MKLIMDRFRTMKKRNNFFYLLFPPKSGHFVSKTRLASATFTPESPVNKGVSGVSGF